MRLTLALAAALLLTGCEPGDFDAFEAHFENRYDLQPGARLNVENLNGSVEIIGWDRNEIEITGVRFASSQQLLDEMRIDIQHTANAVYIRTVTPSGRFGNMGARYTIHVPRMTVVDRIRASNGSILLRDILMHGIEGGSRIQTANLRTSNASIRAENIQGAIDAQTSNGPVELNEVSGAVSVRTSNGRITIQMDRAGAAPLRATTSNGRIDITLRSELKDDIRAETSNGSITLHLPAGTDAHLIADTSNAQISTDFDIRDRERAEKHVDGTLGKGGPEIELTTRNGPISVLKTTHQL